jgi:hypothetical protein
MGGGLVLMGDNREVRGAPNSRGSAEANSGTRIAPARSPTESSRALDGNVQCSEEVAPHATVGFGLRLSSPLSQLTALFFLFFAKKPIKTCSISPSRVVPHRSTTDTRGSLTSLFGWEAVTLPDVAARII